MKFAIVRVVVRLMASSALILGFGISPALAQSSLPLVVPAVPDTLQVPVGHELFLGVRAVGTQNYVCVPTAKRTVGWRFIGPQATSFVDTASGLPQQVQTHFLSVNPVEGTLARPTWQHSADTSRVWGRVLASSADPKYVEAGAIPWLLLETAGTEVGPSGGAFMTQTTFIHRVSTSGGIAPASGCTDDDHIGKVALVPYSTDYFFYRAVRD